MGKPDVLINMWIWCHRGLVGGTGDKYWALKPFCDQLRFGDSEGPSVWEPNATHTLHSAFRFQLHWKNPHTSFVLHRSQRTPWQRPLSTSLSPPSRPLIPSWPPADSITRLRGVGNLLSGLRNCSCVFVTFNSSETGDRREYSKRRTQRKRQRQVRDRETEIQPQRRPHSKGTQFRESKYVGKPPETGRQTDS